MTEWVQVSDEPVERKIKKTSSPSEQSGPTNVARTSVRQVNLRTAPCTSCKIPVIFGQRNCLGCGQQFNYGANPPPEPARDVIEAAYARALVPKPRDEHPTAELDTEQQQLLSERIARNRANAAAAQAQLDAKVAAQIASPLQADVVAQLDIQAQINAQIVGQAPTPPIKAESFIDRGRYEVVAGAVQTEVPPGFIDSTLFGAFTPDDDTSTPLPGLEGTQYDVDASANAPASSGQQNMMLGLEVTSQTDSTQAGPVATESIPGFIDSTLFGAFTPDVVETEDVAGLITSPSAPRDFTSASAQQVSPCDSCGTKFDEGRSRCPSCGTPRSSDI